MSETPRHPAPSLLESLQSLIERTYRMETGIADIGRYVIGDEGYRLLYGPGTAYDDGSSSSGRCAQARCREASGSVGAAGSAAGGAKVLVHDLPGAVAACIYYPDLLIRELEEHPPSRGIGDRNVDAFATFVEELDHLLLIAERVRLGRPVSLLELEMHANVTKYLVCAMFIAADGMRGPFEVAERLWLRWHLFEKSEFVEPDPGVCTRYRDAARFSRRFLDRLDRVSETSARIAFLREFHDASHQSKLAAFA